MRHTRWLWGTESDFTVVHASQWLSKRETCFEDRRGYKHTCRWSYMKAGNYSACFKRGFFSKQQRVSVKAAEKPIVPLPAILLFFCDERSVDVCVNGQWTATVFLGELHTAHVCASFSVCACVCGAYISVCLHVNPKCQILRLNRPPLRNYLWCFCAFAQKNLTTN